jgi:hypothetical protein
VTQVAATQQEVQAVVQQEAQVDHSAVLTAVVLQEEVQVVQVELFVAHTAAVQQQVRRA